MILKTFHVILGVAIPSEKPLLTKMVKYILKQKIHTEQRTEETWSIK